VPGCPPRPEALLNGIMKLQEQIGSESLHQRLSNGNRPEPIVVEGAGEPQGGAPVDQVEADA
jgi:NADH:ubiquinone oxidoreductase subunit B-like Fe-S oxidoreductase